MSSALAASPDGQWVAVRRGDQLAIHAGGVGPALGRTELGSDDADIALVGSPAVLVAVVRNVAPRVMIYQPPNLDIGARHDLDRPMRIAAATGSRVALLSADHKRLVLVRIAPNALAAQTIDLDAPTDFVVGLDKQQLLVSIQRKLEVWDATTGRPSLRMQLQLPPPPRTVGAAQGHIWVTRPSADDVIVYRLSDGRPFRHVVGAPTTAVFSSMASPIIVVGTQRGLIRLHCFAHSLGVIDAPWQPGMPAAQLVTTTDEIALVGLADNQAEPWRIPLVGSGAPTMPLGELPPEIQPTRPDAVVRFKTNADRPAPSTETAPASTTPAPPPPSPPASASPPARTPRPRVATVRDWRDALANIGAELVEGGQPELAVTIDDSQLAELADRLLLGKKSIRALGVLYGVYLVGEPELSIADLAQLLGDWTEPLGTGELGALGMLHRERGRVSLHPAVTDLLDGNPPRAVRLAGHAPSPAAKPHAGAWRFAREGRTDAEVEAMLAGKLGRIAVVDGDPDRALLEARLHGATAVAFSPPERRPHPWPRDAGLVLVLYGSPSSWIADLPSLAG